MILIDHTQSSTRVVPRVLNPIKIQARPRRNYCFVGMSFLFCLDEFFILLKWAFCLDNPGSKKVPHAAQPTTYLVRGSTWDTEKGRILWTMYQAKHKKKH